jgi:hypothetical protein
VASIGIGSTIVPDREWVVPVGCCREVVRRR